MTNINVILFSKFLIIFQDFHKLILFCFRKLGFLINVLTFCYEFQILDLKKKQESQVQLLKQKQKSDEAAKRLQAEIQYIKAQKVGSHFSAYSSLYSQIQHYSVSHFLIHPSCSTFIF